MNYEPKGSFFMYIKRVVNMAKRGRKSRYETHVKPYLERIPKWRRDGLTEKQVATKLGVAYSTFRKYIKEFPALMAALKKGKAELIEEIEDSLYKKAQGFECEETKTYIEKNGNGRQKQKVEKIKKFFPPDTTAIIFALTNLRKEKWKHKQQIEHTGKMEHDIFSKPDLSKLNNKELEDLEKLIKKSSNPSKP